MRNGKLMHNHVSNNNKKKIIFKKLNSTTKNPNLGILEFYKSTDPKHIIKGIKWHRTFIYMFEIQPKLIKEAKT
jgi:hypothetical protein